MSCPPASRHGAEIVFESSVEFIDNVASGYGGAILNHATLDFRDADGISLHFQGNYCGEQEVSISGEGSHPFTHDDVNGGA